MFRVDPEQAGWPADIRRTRQEGRQVDHVVHAIFQDDARQRVLILQACRSTHKMVSGAQRRAKEGCRAWVGYVGG